MSKYFPFDSEGIIVLVSEVEVSLSCKVNDVWSSKRVSSWLWHPSITNSKIKSEPALKKLLIEFSPINLGMASLAQVFESCEISTSEFRIIKLVNSIFSVLLVLDIFLTLNFNFLNG